jgi:hypothetical protein
MGGQAPIRTIFVGGAPRSGTTVLHALLCTAPGMSRYNPEISFFRGYMAAFRNGRAAWDQHTSAYFASPGDFLGLIRETCDLALGRIWRALGGPDLLAVKDPLLTPFFADLHQVYPQDAWFVTVCRNPMDVVRSRQEVHEKSTPERPFSAADAALVAREWLACYRGLMQADFHGRHFMCRYEDLNSDELRRRLAAFLGVPGFDVASMWGERRVDASGGPWGSPKYNGAIDLTQRLGPLAPDLAETTRAICAPIMARLGYG